MVLLHEPQAGSADVESRIADYLQEQENKTLLRFLACGSVDDGKSTLIGRLLYDAKGIFEDQLAHLKNDSRKFGTTGDDIDFALLMDGLEAEREQGITIDVAYRFFSTKRRKFIVADTPGHAEYTRNMATGASTADLAIVLVDAREGLITQTRRHSFIASLLGVRHIILAVNKIDLIDFSKEIFEAIAADYLEMTKDFGFASIETIPISARFGDNVSVRSAHTPWYQGPTLLEHLETVPLEKTADADVFRFPVQYVSRPNADFRGFAGTLSSGHVRVGDMVVVAKTGKQTKLRRIISPQGDLQEAFEGQAVTLLLEDELELSRGSMLSGLNDRPILSDQLVAQMINFDDAPLRAGQSYWLRTETDQVSATITKLQHRIDIETFIPSDAHELTLNEIGLCHLQLNLPLVFDLYQKQRSTGAFVLIDRVTNKTIAAGMIRENGHKASNIHWQALVLDAKARAEQKFQKPVVLWFTGLSGSGKSTLAGLLEKRLHSLGKHTYLLDGDNLRHGLNHDLGFSEKDRSENIRRIGEVSHLMLDAGLIVLAALITPLQADRDRLRTRFNDDELIEIFVDTSLEICIERDPKGLYAKALAGEIKDFTGIDAPYQCPVAPDLYLKTKGRSVEELLGEIEHYLTKRGIIGSYGTDSWSI
ncbi:sulfate adenylyltransferase subunit CysN [Paenochrobactrum sp. BZR 588]|uniref:sulfate adenylyltransferase subunit CysN n=1 Tax=unclassified Paenochrobactrum TaxID=2639760 RepID=UPI0038528A29